MIVFKSFFLAVISLCVASSVAAGSDWVDAKNNEQILLRDVVGHSKVKIRKARYLRGDTLSIRAKLLAQTPFVDLTIPLPDGSMTTYRLQSYAIAEPAFMDAHPELRAFRGVDLNNPANTGHFDITSKGLRAMFRYDGATVLIDPDDQAGEGSYVAYFGKDAISPTSRMQEVVGGEWSLIN